MTIYRLAAAGAALLAAAAVAPLATAQDGDMLDRQIEDLRQGVCPAPPGSAAPAAETAPLAVGAAQVFDNFYFLGTRSSSAWALTTSEGIILIEAMFAGDVEEVVDGGLRSLGLDPADIKYVLVTHAHNDHFGGAAHLQEAYGAKVVMSHADWYYLTTWPQRGEPAPLPKRDLTVLDGDALTLGDATVQIVATPGHTPGTISLLFTVRDGAASHRVAYWSGASMSYLSPEELEVYVRSVDRFGDLAAEAGADVLLSHHAFADGTEMRIEALQSRAPGASHPFVIGEEGVRDWLAALRGCATAWIEQKREAGASTEE